MDAPVPAPACCSGALPIPGLPHGPTSPFTYPVLGSAVVHLLAQTLVFGAGTVLIDVGVMQLLRRAWHRMVHHASSTHSDSRTPPDGSTLAVTTGKQLPAAARGVGAAVQGHSTLSDAENGAAGVMSRGAGEGYAGSDDVDADADVVAEQRAVAAGEDVGQAMVRGCGEGWLCLVQPCSARSGVWCHCHALTGLLLAVQGGKHSAERA